MGPKTSAPNVQPTTSLRQKMVERRKEFAKDTMAQADPMGIIQKTVIGFLVILFVSFLLFTKIGPDTNTICNDVESSPGAGDGNYTQDECDDAQDSRGMFFTVLVIAGVAALLIVLAVALAQLNKGRG